nr:Wadjet anti-phage system protein JetD domain-containing protein [uncultured Clostridium sp.]
MKLNDIQEYFKLYDYKDLMNFISVEKQQGRISEVKSSKTNGMNPPLYNKYKLLPLKEDNKNYIEEINYLLYFSFSKNYYLNNINKYKEDRTYINDLTSYFRENKLKLEIPMSINERSYDIWGEEKFLKDGGGKSILKNLGIIIEELNIYRTPEPFVYFSSNKSIHQRVLILENKDTWYTLRKLMLEGENMFIGEKIDTIIYGAGKGIEKSLEDFETTVPEYLRIPIELLYWGDIDYEGIGIYERVKERYSDLLNIKLFKEAYSLMLKLSKNKTLAVTKDKQNKNIKDEFFNELTSENIEEINHILSKKLYIPQEIVNYEILKGGNR